MIGQTIAHYKVLQKIGEGGMGVVYRAEDVTLGRNVALKFLPARAVLTDEDRNRFTREAQLAASLSNPHIATVYEFGEAEGQAFLAMEYIEGETLARRVKSQRLSLEESINIATDVAEGLAKAHSKGIVHRDIKPENIMISRDGTIKIMDFGLAEIAGRSRITETGVTVGTVAYMSPEQARGEAVDFRTDIWSWGVTMYEAITGGRAFPGHYEAAVIYLILHEEPESIGKVRADVPVKLEQIIQRAMRKDPEQRYRSVEEIRNELKSLRREMERGEVRREVREALAPRKYESERRQVTILFAALTGFETLAEEVDPEVLSSAINDCIKGLSPIIRRYEGMTDRIVGEKVMAIFGAPVAHENDPERAVRCALEMTSYMERFNSIGAIQLPVPLGLQIGIHSGMVIAGSVGTEKEAEYSVIGETVNLAAGIVGLAPAGAIYLSSDVYKLVGDLVQVEEVRTSGIKGKAQPIDIYPLRGLKAGIEPGRRVIGGGAFVGRKKELQGVGSSLERVLRKSEVRLYVRGEPGVGKTRLKDEMVRLAQKKGMAVCEGKCSSFELSTPYYLWNTFLKSLLRIGVDTAESEMRLRLHDTLQILGLEPEEPYLATLLSLRYEEILMEVDAERKRKIFEATRKLMVAFASRRPSLFVFEDLHWIDRFSQELLEFVFAGETIAPALFCCLFRAEYTQAEKLTQRGELLDLDRLPDDEARELMRSRLGAQLVPKVLEELVDKRAEGNPFFIEEIIKTLLDRKVVGVKKGNVEILSENLEAGVPETLQGVILARIDRLEEKIREVLLDASVIGREFSRSVLERVLEERRGIEADLHQLEMMELILEKEEARELEYLFKHYLIQEVAYNTLLAKKRKRLHGLIARAIETLYAERLKEFYELLAFHYEKAEEWEKAADYLGRAGRKAGEIFTREETNLFEGRRDEAIKKIYESRSAKRLGWKILGFATGAVIVPLVLSLLGVTILAATLLWNLVSASISYLDYDLTVANVQFILPLSLVFAVTLCLLWGSLLFTFFGIRPFFSRSAKVYDLSEESIQIWFRGKKKFVIHFSEIEAILFREYRPKQKRRIRDRLLDPFSRVQDYSKVTLWKLLKRWSLRVPGHSFGFSSAAGEIQVIRKKGIAGWQLVFPFLYVARFSRIFVLSPSDPKEFHEQLETAYAKWQKGEAARYD